VDDLLAIGEFAERSGLSPKRLRSYAAVGLLVPAAVDAQSGYRYYAPGQLRDARLIDTLRQAGMSLADIAKVLRDQSDGRLDAWAARLETDATQRRSALASARRLLAAAAASRPPAHVDISAKGTTMTTLISASRTDIGCERENNEDSIAVDRNLAAVADGMGGAPAGEVASAIAIALLQAAFTGRSLDELTAGVRAANRAIWDRASTRAELQGMGSTICAVGLTADGNLSVVNVGDSRAYLFRDGELRQLTQDHTVTAELVRRGELDSRDAIAHPHRHVLTRVLGVGPSIDPDGAVHRPVDGDRVLVCSDGLFNEVPDDQIASVMAHTNEIQSAADALVELALSVGARDNVAVVVAEVCN
jgi:protein phosphatase